MENQQSLKNVGSLSILELFGGIGACTKALKNIGMDVNVSFKRFETTLPEKYRLAEGESMLNAVEFIIDDDTNKVTEIKRIRI